MSNYDSESNAFWASVAVALTVVVVTAVVVAAIKLVPAAFKGAGAVINTYRTTDNPILWYSLIGMGSGLLFGLFTAWVTPLDTLAAWIAALAAIQWLGIAGVVTAMAQTSADVPEEDLDVQSVLRPW
jgi:hypothetical protein